jgi:hypothetical protein
MCYLAFSISTPPFSKIFIIHLRFKSVGTPTVDGFTGALNFLIVTSSSESPSPTGSGKTDPATGVLENTFA